MGFAIAESVRIAIVGNVVVRQLDERQVLAIGRPHGRRVSRADEIRVPAVDRHDVNTASRHRRGVGEPIPSRRPGWTLDTWRREDGAVGAPLIGGGDDTPYDEPARGLGDRQAALGAVSFAHPETRGTAASAHEEHTSVARDLRLALILRGSEKA